MGYMLYPCSGVWTNTTAAVKMEKRFFGAAEMAIQLMEVFHKQGQIEFLRCRKSNPSRRYDVNPWSSGFGSF